MCLDDLDRAPFPFLPVASTYLLCGQVFPLVKKEQAQTAEDA